MAHKFPSSKRLMRYTSAASSSAMIVVPWNHTPGRNCWPISCTRCMNGNFLINKSVLLWYLLISHRACVPSQKQWGFFTPPVAGILLRATLAANLVGSLFFSFLDSPLTLGFGPCSPLLPPLLSTLLVTFFFTTTN